MFSRQGAKSSLAVLVILLATQIGFVPAAYSFGRKIKPVSSRPCNTYLKKLEASKKLLETRFKNYAVVPLPDEAGVVLKLKNGISSGMQIYQVIADSDEFDFLSNSVWLDGEQRIEFVNVGYKNLERYSLKVNKAVLHHLNNFPDQDLTILFDPLRSFVGHVLRAHRWAVHNAVMNNYWIEKPYFSDLTIETLIKVNMYSGNSDVLALLKFDPNSLPLNLPIRQLEENLLMTSQISYFGDRDYTMPTLRGILEAADYPVWQEMDQLPMEYRVDPKKRKVFREQLYARANPADTGEVIRTARFDKLLKATDQLSKQAKAKFFLSIYDTAKARGLRRLVVDVDKDLGAYFYNFGLREVMEIPIDPAEKTARLKAIKKRKTEGSDKPGEEIPEDVREYVYDIMINSELFLETCRQLSIIAQGISEYPEVTE